MIYKYYIICIYFKYFKNKLNILKVSKSKKYINL